MSAPIKLNRRLGNRKTRTGCITCKIRRVKCGEERPSCLRCVKTGRKCDGYLPPDQPRPATSTHSESLHSTPIYHEISHHAFPTDTEEHVVFQYFLRNVADQIGGCVDDGFWTRLMPQRSQYEPAVGHAIIAIGSLLLHARHGSKKSELTCLGQPYQPTSIHFALKHYAKAINSTLSAIQNKCGNMDLALITCMLFVCIEALQGHEKEVLSLFHQGQKALTQSGLSTRTDSSKPLSRPPEPCQGISYMFRRLGAQCMMFDLPTAEKTNLQYPALFDPILTILQPFDSIYQARKKLFDLLHLVQSVAFVGYRVKWAHRWAYQQTQERFTTSPSEELEALLARQREIEFALEYWYQHFQRIITKSSKGPSNTNGDKEETTRNEIALMTLSQQYRMIKLWLLGSLTPNETLYDNYTLEFTAVIAEAKSTIDLMSKLDSIKTFSFEMGIVPPLYWTAIKCRDPTIRRQALSLLEDSPRLEGLWDSRVIVKVARRVIELEETTDDLDLASSLPVDNSNHNLPPEEKRIKAVQIGLRTDVDGEQGDFVDFLRLPKGYDGGWDVRREFVSVD